MPIPPARVPTRTSLRFWYFVFSNSQTLQPPPHGEPGTSSFHSFHPGLAERGRSLQKVAYAGDDILCGWEREKLRKSFKYVDVIIIVKRQV